MSNIYGINRGYATGQGSFIFDRICCNRYDLDYYAEKDNVLVGRYAIVEYDQPVMNYIDLQGKEYHSSQIYNIYKLKEGVDIDFNDNNKEYIFAYHDVIDGKYQYRYILKPEEGTVLDFENNFSIFDIDTTGYITPAEFNAIVDNAYANNNDIDDIVLPSGNIGWDSTAWLKVAIKGADNTVKFQYLNIANLNVVAPKFESGENLSGTFTFENEEYKYLNPVVSQDNIMDASNYKIHFPKPIDIEAELDIDTSNTDDKIETEIISIGEDENKIYTGKKFIFQLPTIGNARQATMAAQSAAEAAAAATTAANGIVEQAATAVYTYFADTDGINIKVDWDINSATQVTGLIKIPVYNKPGIVNNDIIDLAWNNASWTIIPNNPDIQDPEQNPTGGEPSSEEFQEQIENDFNSQEEEESNNPGEEEENPGSEGGSGDNGGSESGSDNGESGDDNGSGETGGGTNEGDSGDDNTSGNNEPGDDVDPTTPVHSGEEPITPIDPDPTQPPSDTE